MKKIIVIMFAAVASLAMVSCNQNSAKVELKTTEDSLSYAIGMRLYDMYISDRLNNDTDSTIVKAAFNDMVNGSALLTEEQEEQVIMLDRRNREIDPDTALNNSDKKYWHYC